MLKHGNVYKVGSFQNRHAKMRQKWSASPYVVLGHVVRNFSAICILILSQFTSVRAKLIIL